MIWTDPLLAILIMAGAYFLGRRWAAADFREINERIASHNPIGLNHAALLAWRITVLVIGLFLCWCSLKWTGSSMWLLVACAALAWATFGSVHVYRLNTLRGLDWRYMSPSNNWDWFWLRTVGYHWREADTREHTTKYNGTGVFSRVKQQYRSNVHKAGSRAMVFRVSIAGMALITFTIHSFLA